MSLPASLKSRYFIDGFYSPIKLFNSQEISKVNSEYQKYVKKFGKDGVLEGDYRFRVHLLARWAHDLVTHPLLVAAVKTVLDTNNILCWSSDICRKPAHSRGVISWHQDSAYSGLEPSDAVVTAWVALSPSTRDTGAVVMWPGSQERTLQHARGESEGGHPDNQLVLGQFIPDTELAQLEHQGAGQEACLAAGEVSLHSWRCVHSSGPNTTDTDRVGLAIRYSTAVQRTTVQYSTVLHQVHVLRGAEHQGGGAGARHAGVRPRRPVVGSGDGAQEGLRGSGAGVAPGECRQGEEELSAWTKH